MQSIPSTAFNLFFAGMMTVISTAKATMPRMKVMKASVIVTRPDFCILCKKDRSLPRAVGGVIRDATARTPTMAADMAISHVSRCSGQDKDGLMTWIHMSEVWPDERIGIALGELSPSRVSSS